MIDFKKIQKELYPTKTNVEIVDVPSMNFLLITGQGNPNEEEGEYSQAVGKLFSVAYALKMSYKTTYQIEGFYEYVVPPLEGFWWMKNFIGCRLFDYQNLLKKKMFNGLKNR